MTVRTYSAENNTDVTVTTTTEAQGVELAGVTTVRAGQTITLIGTVVLDSGAGTTAVTPRIRRGNDQTGTAVSDAVAQETTAANAATWTVHATDAPGEVTGQSYEITVQQTGATGNGTIAYASLTAIVPR